MATKLKPLPLTRRERKILAAAREHGLDGFSSGIAKPDKRFMDTLSRLTDNERHWLFVQLEDYCVLTVSIRGTN